jgi:hypothetical protein
MGWFNQHSKLTSDFNVKGIAEAVEEGPIIAVA